MAKKSTKSKGILASLEKQAEKEPKTMKGKYNKALAGDGRKNPKNLTNDELVAGILGFNKKKKK